MILKRCANIIYVSKKQYNNEFYKKIHKKTFLLLDVIFLL